MSPFQSGGICYVTRNEDTRDSAAERENPLYEKAISAEGFHIWLKGVYPVIVTAMRSASIPLHFLQSSPL